MAQGQSILYVIMGMTIAAKIASFQLETFHPIVDRQIPA
jgi:hypothetical protein